MPFVVFFLQISFTHSLESFTVLMIRTRNTNQRYALTLPTDYLSLSMPDFLQIEMTWNGGR